MKHAVMLFLALLVVTTISVAQSNPFTQPTPTELAAAVRVIHADSRCPAKPRFVATSLAEPSKSMWLDAKKRAGIPREIRATVVDPSAPKVYEFTVDVKQQLVTEVRAVPPVQWMLTESDYSRADSMMRASPRLRDALRRRGLTVDSIAVETWASGVPVPQASRFARCLFYALDAEGVNRYDRPVEGVAVITLRSCVGSQRWRIHYCNTSTSCCEWRSAVERVAPDANAHRTRGLGDLQHAMG
jgi:Cu2+-containing amine oxidase